MKSVKSFIAILLTAILVLALPIVSMAKEEKEEAVAISDAAGFAAIETGRDYYLTADITVTETHTTAYAGNFDGKGHKITTTVTLFDSFEGSAKDLTIEGSVSSTADRGGVFANTITGNTVLSGIVNKASMTGSTTKVSSSDGLEVVGSYGGIFGTSAKSIELTVENCVNYGKITGYNAGGICGKNHAKLSMKNCSNFGDVVGTDVGGGLIAWGWGDFTMENCVNGSKTVVPDITASTDAPGGMVSYISGSTDANFINCINYGYIHTVDESAGGIVGRSGAKGDHVYKNCINYGPITGTKAGGMAGTDGGLMNAENCFNYGEIKGVKQGGGIVASLGHDDTSGTAIITGCGNEAKVTTEKDTAGGIVGYANGSSMPLKITGCYNIADVTGGCEASGILGYINGSPDTEVSYCFNTGKIVTTDSGEKSIALFYNKSSGAKTAETAKGNFYLAGTAEKAYKNEGNYIDADAGVTADDFASGKICFMINDAAGVELFKQTIGTDAVPTLDPASKTVISDGGTYKNPAEVVPETPVTGDASAIVFVIAAVSILGMGIALKARKN